VAQPQSAEVTGLLKAWSDGDPAALDRLAAKVYRELHGMARRYMKNERAGNTLQTTALVNEVYLRLVDVKSVEWKQRAQFFAIAAQMMRRILVDAARARGSHKRGGGAIKVNVGRCAGLVAGTRFIAGGLGRGVGSILKVGSPAGQSGRTEVFRWAKRRGNCRGSESHLANREARLGLGKVLADA